MIHENVNKLELGKITSSSDVVLLKFGAPWCGPCKTLDGTLETLNDETEGLTIAKVNVDDHPELAIEYAVMGIPAMFFLKNGEVVEQAIGVKSLAMLKETFEKVKA